MGQIKGWVQTWMSYSRNGVMRALTFTHWVMYLQQQASFSASSLAAELATVLGPLVYSAQESTQEDRLQDVTPTCYVEGKEGPLAHALYTHGSSCDTIP